MVPARCRTTQRDDMADLQTALVHDDALDDELQDSLLVSERGVVKSALNTLTERCQVGQHRLGPALLAAV